MIENIEEASVLILRHLKSKPLHEWSPETTIEQAMDGTIHYYHVREALQLLLQDGKIDFSRLGTSYKINSAGRAFINQQHTQ